MRAFGCRIRRVPSSYNPERCGCNPRLEVENSTQDGHGAYCLAHRTLMASHSLKGCEAQEVTRFAAAHGE